MKLLASSSNQGPGPGRETQGTHRQCPNTPVLSQRQTSLLRDLANDGDPLELRQSALRSPTPGVDDARVICKHLGLGTPSPISPCTPPRVPRDIDASTPVLGGISPALGG